MRKVLLAVACWATISLGNARADIAYSYVTDAASYGSTAKAGDVVTVSLYLQETLTNGSVSLVMLDGGLFGAGIMVTRSSGDATIFDQSIGFPGFILYNDAKSPDGFGGKNNVPPFAALPPKAADNTPATLTQAGLVENADTGANGTAHQQLGPQVAPPGTATSKFLIGTTFITVGNTQSTFRLDPYSLVQSGFSISQVKTDFDITGNGTTTTQNPNGYTYTGARDAALYTFTVGAAVPEPSSMALCGLIASGMGYAGFRRRKASKTVA